jgi:hypothetical protein
LNKLGESTSFPFPVEISGNLKYLLHGIKI